MHCRDKTAKKDSHSLASITTLSNKLYQTFFARSPSAYYKPRLFFSLHHYQTTPFSTSSQRHIPPSTPLERILHGTHNVLCSGIEVLS